MNSEVFILYNINKMINEKNVKIYIIEYLNIINFSNLSLYKLKLKIDIIIILLCNLNSFIKLYNKIYFYIIHINQWIIECEIFNDKYINNMIMISWILLSFFSIKNLSFNFRWTQFLLWLIFVMTINKA